MSICSIIKNLFREDVSKLDTNIILRRAEKYTLDVNGNSVSMFLLRARKNAIGVSDLYCHGGTFDVKMSGLYMFNEAYQLMLNGHNVAIVKFPDEDHPDIIKEPDPNLDIIEIKDASYMLRELTKDAKINMVTVSRGGYSGLLAVAKYPTLFNRIVCFVPPIDMENKAWLKTQAEWAVKFLTKVDKSPMQLAREGAYKDLKDKMLMIGGGQDPVCPPLLHSDKFASIVGCKSHIVRGAKHDAHKTKEGYIICERFLR